MVKLHMPILFLVLIQKPFGKRVMRLALGGNMRNWLIGQAVLHHGEVVRLILLASFSGRLPILPKPIRASEARLPIGRTVLKCAKDARLNRFVILKFRRVKLTVFMVLFRVMRLASRSLFRLTCLKLMPVFTAGLAPARAGNVFSRCYSLAKPIRLSVNCAISGWKCPNNIALG